MFNIYRNPLLQMNLYRHPWQIPEIERHTAEELMSVYECIMEHDFNATIYVPNAAEKKRRTADNIIMV
jgi:hypothetical protein